ncbi:hypothetical protein DV704_04090 [Meiothermus sp. QL-1]|uniref:hypothetical protein n=1 Tax=Meiothermus sp. QL-1 TaxID=2058095 RepID=UPI000E0B6E6B|nr:hypothetical protein [Meiothermus sp. QL-1]RDI96106.1 hypothetical protein DV704_04090 [Meiothermus sp. QL-1]
MRPALLALFPPLLLLNPTLPRFLLLPLLLSCLLLWGAKGAPAALPAFPALGTFFFGGYLLEHSSLRFPNWPLSYRFAWGVLAVLPWGLGVYGFWLGVFRLEPLFLSGGTALSLLGFLSLRRHLLEGLGALQKRSSQKEPRKGKL